MGQQKYSGESNWQHEPRTEHNMDDSFGEGNKTRNWQKNPPREVLDRSEGKKNDSEQSTKKDDKPLP